MCEILETFQFKPKDYIVFIKLDKEINVNPE